MSAPFQLLPIDGHFRAVFSPERLSTSSVRDVAAYVAAALRNSFAAKVLFLEACHHVVTVITSDQALTSSIRRQGVALAHRLCSPPRPVTRVRMENVGGIHVSHLREMLSAFGEVKNIRMVSVLSRGPDSSYGTSALADIVAATTIPPSVECARDGQIFSVIIHAFTSASAARRRPEGVSPELRPPGEDVKEPATLPQAASKLVACRDWGRGLCQRGPACRFSHAHPSPARPAISTGPYVHPQRRAAVAAASTAASAGAEPNAAVADGWRTARRRKPAAERKSAAAPAAERKSDAAPAAEREGDAEAAAERESAAAAGAETKESVGAKAAGADPAAASSDRALKRAAGRLATRLQKARTPRRSNSGGTGPFSPTPDMPRSDWTLRGQGGHRASSGCKADGSDSDSAGDSSKHKNCNTALPSEREEGELAFEDDGGDDVEGAAAAGAVCGRIRVCDAVVASVAASVGAAGGRAAGSAEPVAAAAKEALPRFVAGTPEAHGSTGARALPARDATGRFKSCSAERSSAPPSRAVRAPATKQPAKQEAFGRSLSGTSPPASVSARRSASAQPQALASGRSHTKTAAPSSAAGRLQPLPPARTRSSHPDAKAPKWN